MKRDGKRGTAGGHQVEWELHEFASLSLLCDSVCSAKSNNSGAEKTKEVVKGEKKDESTAAWMNEDLKTDRVTLARCSNGD